MSTTCKVLPGGPIFLGNSVSADGASWTRPTRVISHVHDDHFREFEQSLGSQDPLVMLPATLDLVYAIKGPHALRLRRNLKAIPADTPEIINAERITLTAANHILGSAQVTVETGDGKRYGYTGDFWWPITPLKGLDELVLDATYGNPEYVRSYSEDQVAEELVTLVRRLLDEGKRVCIKAVTGRLQYVMQLLQAHIRVPFLAGKKQTAVAAVYQCYGCLADPVLDRHDTRGQAIITARERHLSFHHLGEKVPESDFDAFVIVSAYMVPREEPIVQYGDKTYRVALTDHADFHGTIDYVAAASPKVVIVDNSRGGDARTLAEEIRARLSIRAVVGGA